MLETTITRCTLVNTMTRSTPSCVMGEEQKEKSHELEQIKKNTGIILHRLKQNHTTTSPAQGVQYAKFPDWSWQRASEPPSASMQPMMC